MPIDPENLERLIDGYWSVLLQWVGEARDGADDIVQAAFIRLAAQDPPPANCVAWLFTVCRRLAINQHASRIKRRLRESAVGAQRLQAIDSADGFEVRDLLDTLETHVREIVIARIWGELTFDEIAAVYGESKASVWRTYQSGISKLRETYNGCSDE